MYNLKSLPEDFIVEELPGFTQDDSGPYFYYLLEKKERNTEDVIRYIASRFHVERKLIGYAGTKDRNAVTKQYISTKRKLPEISEDSFSLKLAGRGNEPLSLGDHNGNRFTITVRNIDSKPKKAEKFVNYFGEQRFGRHNAQIGKNIVFDELETACSLIDGPKVKEHLDSHPRDYVGAISKMPFKILNLYIHAYQSLLWNEAAARYVKKHSKNQIVVDYSQGELAFTKEKLDDVEIPLISFDTEFKDDEIETLYDDIMDKQGITLRDLVLRKFPDLTPTGGKRNLLAQIKNLEISELEDDELNPGKKKVKMTFVLDKGCYATVAVRSMFC